MSEEVQTQDAKVAQAAQAAQAAQTQQESTELTVADLNALKTIIDIASSRGAFKPNEMVAVGSVYNKLSVFLSAVAKQPATGA